MIVVDVPGKLYVAGEYAVLEPGSPAVLICVDRYVRARLRMTGAARRTITSGHLPDRAVEFVRRGMLFEPVPHADTAGPTHVLAALAAVDRYAAEAGREPVGFDLDIDSQLDDSVTGRKFGLGSSGAVTVAVVRAAARAYRLSLDAEAELKLALLATFSVDPHCSGGDVAASARGGWVYYRTPDRAALAAALRRPGHSLAALVTRAWPLLEARSIRPPRELSLQVGWVGRPARSSALVQAMKRAVAEHPSEYRQFVAASGHCVDELAAGCDRADPRAITGALATAGRLLRGLTALSGVAIESPELTRLRRIAEELGAVAKSSGAGGGDCGIALADPAVAPTLRRRWRDAAIEPLDLRVHQPVPKVPERCGPDPAPTNPAVTKGNR
ncbi:phosphomevalonate kinase [Nocardia blacklockiae]|uniref:phosphomevalonate kinase n=1 Tax=Nocardia blacklockiae TaxID=480036 RepID=UPI0018936035|nr:phosphomevalonate kinase [Nocardia blacklockiae]MBF6169865.1 phosphomevalonate kinase [Nocardia blacklockiae]